MSKQIPESWAEDEMWTGDIHVLPLDDLLPHTEEGTECMCDPRIEVVGANLIVVHNAYDGRK